MPRVSKKLLEPADKNNQLQEKLVLPIPVSEGQKYLNVDLSFTDKVPWGEVDFKNSDYDPIFRSKFLILNSLKYS